MEQVTSINQQLTSSNVELVGDGLWSVVDGDYRGVVIRGCTSALAVNQLGVRGAPLVLPTHSLKAIVVSIDHRDHMGQLAEAEGLETIAHALCAAAITGRGQPRVTQIIEGHEQHVDVDGVKMQLLHFGPTQGTGNLAVHLPTQRVLFVVGPRADARYGLLSDFHFRHASRVWRELAKLDVDVVLPGRGPQMERDGLERAADYLDAVGEAAQEAFAGGLPIWEYDAMQPFVSERLHERFGDLFGFDDHIGIAAMRLVHYYLMGGWGMEDSGKPPLVPMSFLH
jgi:glyoxylase-like metal-dependent hydrolase (beta-lactamase superfamily II)